MKRLVILLLAVVVLSGCGKKSDEEFKGVVAKSNYSEQGMQYLKQADIPKAIQSFNKAIQSDPSNPDNYLILGQVYLRLNNNPGAAEVYKAAVKVDPGNGESHYMLGVSQALMGQREEAVKAVKRSIEIFNQEGDKTKLKNALVLLRSLMEPPKPVLDDEMQLPKGSN